MPTGAPPLNFNQTAPGWNTGPSMADTGRYNAMGNRPMPGPGFWPRIAGTLGNTGGSILNLLGRGIGVLANGISGGGANGVTPSAGGWTIDKDGNLVDSTKATDPLAGPRLITHAQGIPGWAAASMAENRKRNLL